MIFRSSRLLCDLCHHAVLLCPTHTHTTSKKASLVIVSGIRMLCLAEELQACVVFLLYMCSFYIAMY